MPRETVQALPNFDGVIMKTWPRGPGRAQPSFGVEIELEGIVFNSDFYNLAAPIQSWNWKDESSLRNNGVEFVSKPVNFTKRAEALGELPVIFKYLQSPPKKTIRCSTHIHINVGYLTFRQVLSSLVLYYLFENLLISTQNTVRKGNVFCLAMTDSRTISSKFRSTIDEVWNFNKIFSKNGSKYSACNLANIGSIGTVEFRFLSPMTDPKDINFWVEVFQSIFDYGSKRDVLTILQEYDKESVPRLFNEIFGMNGPRLYEMIPFRNNYSTLTKAIWANYDDLFDIAFALSKRKYEVPKAYWNPDTLEGNRVPSYYDEFGAEEPPPEPADIGEDEMNAILTELQQTTPMAAQPIPHPTTAPAASPFATPASWVIADDDD